MVVAFVAHKAARVGFGKQTAKGTPATPSLLLPLPEGDELNDNPNYSFFQYSRGHWGLAHWSQEVEQVEGRITLPLVPGYVSSGALYDWIWGRDDDNDTYYATIIRDLGNVVLSYADVKVTTGTITAESGGNYVSLELNLIGAALPASGSLGSSISEALFTLRPYQFHEVSISVAATGDSLASRAYTRNHRIEFDNHIVSGGDMGVLNGSTFPYALPSEAATNWTVTFDELFLDDDLIAAFLDQDEYQYCLTLSRTGVAGCTFTMPRCVITAYPVNIPDSGILRADGVSLQALASLDDETPACTIAEIAY